MLRAAICDDDAVILKQMEHCIRTVFEASRFRCTLECYTDEAFFLERNRQKPYDIVFLDIFLQQHTGFDIAKELRQQKNDVLLIFVTSQDTLVYRSLEYRPFQFVRKGQSEVLLPRLRAVTEKIVSYYRETELLELDLGVGERRVVVYRDILFLQSSLHYLEYHLNSGEVLRVRERMADACEQLAAHGFLRIHRQYIVNLQAVARMNISTRTIHLFSGEVLPIGRTYRQQAVEEYGRQMRKIP